MGLSEAVKHQSEFEFHDVKGKIIGFWTPKFEACINDSGFHLHFITDDKTSRGHILKYQFDNVKVEYEGFKISKGIFLKMVISKKADLTKTSPKDVKKAESDHWPSKRRKK